ncbi:mitochondrial 54S ribosomal protein rml2 [Xanthoria calcicola]
MLQPRICLRQIQHLRTLLPYTPLRNYAEAQAIDHKPPPPITATSTQPEVNPYESSVRPEDTPEPPFQLRSYKPRTPGIRHLRRPINDHLHRGRAHLPLTFPRKGQHIGGRNNSGQIRVRHRGNGAKRRIRIVDFHRFAPGKHTVERIEYDPGRSAHIALVHDNAAPAARKSYILAAQGMRAGDEVESFRAGVPRLLLEALGGSTDAGMIAAKTAWRGNCLPLHMIPTGTLVHNVGLRKGGKAQLCRSAGTFAMVIGTQQQQQQDEAGQEKEGVVGGAGGGSGEGEGEGEKRRGKKDLYVEVRLKSGEVRRIHRDACATIGTASNSNYNRRQLGKAGRSRWLGIRPTVRGVAMNASDHPHGGGRGKSKGNVQPVSIWGQLTKGGYKTRKKRNVNRFVVTPRPRGQKSISKAKKKEKKKNKN